MTTQPVEANVVLTADNTAYDQAMMASAGSTNNLTKSLDTLGQKISSVTKTAGKSLIGIAAADIALITGATAAWASYEKQMERLQAQSAILTRTTSQQEKLMGDYTKAVKVLRTEYGTTTTEAAKLVETLSKMTSVRQTRDLSDLSKVFTDMSKATGEGSEGLASSLLNLQKVMGTPINAQDTRKYADMFTYLSAQTQGSATDLINFTAQIAPMGEAMGLNQKQVAGFATAFTRAGQDTGAAATVFNKVAGDITNAMATGSPELKQYANLIGVTSSELSKMDKGEAMVQVFEALHAQGDQAISTLNRFGLEGPRTMKAITALINEPGGVRAGLVEAGVGFGGGAAAGGAKEAAEGLYEEFEKLREEMKLTAETMAQYIGPMVEKFVGGIQVIASNINDVMAGPLGEFLQVVMAVVAPLAGGAGALLLFAGAILKVAAAFAVWRNSMSLGLREGMKGGAGIAALPGGGFGARGEGMLGPRGAQLATDPRSSWLQRTLYNAGQPIGAALGGTFGGIGQAYQAGRAWHDPNYVPGGADQRTLLQRARMVMQPGWEPPPPGPRSALSYVAGGLGRGIQQFVTPQFDQARYINPADRKVWLSQQSPLASMQERSRLSGAMGAVGLAETQLQAQRGEAARIYQDPLLGEQEKRTKLEGLKATIQETQERKKAAVAMEATTRESMENARTQREANRAVKDTTVGHTRLAKALGGGAAGMLGGVYGAGKAGAQALMGSPMGMPIAGTLGMAGLAGLGVESNAAMFGAMGLTMGPGAAAIGVGVGALVDMAKANDEVTASVENVTAAATEASRSGVGLLALDETVQQTSVDLTEYRKSLDTIAGHHFDVFKDPGAKLKSFTEEITGFGPLENEFDELTAKSDRAKESLAATEGTVRALAEGAGVTITGTRRAQLQQLEEFMSTEGAQRLAASGVDMSELVAARKGGLPATFMNIGRAARGEKPTTFDELLARVIAPGQASGLWDRLKAGGGIGAAMVETTASQQSLRFQQDIPKFYEATNTVFNAAVESGKSYQQILKESLETQQLIGSEKDAEYEHAVEYARKAQQALAFQAPQLGRAGAFQQQLDIGQTFLAIRPETTAMVQEIEAQRTTTIGAVGDQLSFLREALRAQDQYDLQRERSQDDFALQRSYQEYDYNLQRERAEENFARMRARSVADFYRGQRRAQYDFNLSRERAEEDFNHSVNIMAKQQAQGVYDIYERVQTERISSASWILSNAQDQLLRMQEQSENLDKLRKRGLSDTAIQQLGLTDPQNAQQLASLMVSLTPQMIRQFNRVAGTERVKAAKDLVTDPSSLEWQEMQRGFRRSMAHAAEDFERQMRLSRKDFRRGLNQQQEDFEIMMADQAEDYRTGIGRQEKAYKQMMDRQAEDFANMGKEILLTNEEVLTQSQERLTGAIGKQARQIGKSLSDLEKSTKPEAVRLMKDLAEIYGFEYTVPKAVTDKAHPGAASPSGYGDNVAGIAMGGVLPGFTPGQDVHQFVGPNGKTYILSGGEAIMRPEWTRMVGEKNIEEMNHQARHGGFFLGGVMPLEGGALTNNHGGAYYGADFAGDINSPYDLRVPPSMVRAWKPGKVANVVSETDSYGNRVEINHDNQNTLYAHLSSIAVRIGQLVSQGQMLGRVGDTGHAFGVHLHFEVDGGSIAMGDLGAGAAYGAGGGSALGTRAVMEQVLRRRYPESEASAKSMQGVHPLWPGDISAIINRYARRKIRQLSRGGGQAGGAHGFDQDNSGSDYANGSVFTGLQNINVGESGPEAVIPLNARGAGFITDVMNSVMGGRNVSRMQGGGTNIFAKVDHSTNFTGPITVQANDPNELIHKLRARQRVMALSRPSLTGSAA